MKLGILGTGNIVQDVLPMMASQNFERIYLLGTKRSEDRTRQLCETYHLDGYFFDLEHLLAADLDAVYIALPNNLHYDYTKTCLEHGKHVFLEKPATTRSGELLELIALAKEKHLILLEAMSLHFTPAYQALKEQIKNIGEIKLINFQFCQYSSRYDRFKQNIIAPAFDPAQAGGALMDLNVYNIQAILGLFGAPISTVYFPNMEKGIDTSGILIMQYPQFQAVAIAAKDCQAPVQSTIQGTKGCLRISMPMNQISSFELLDNKGNATLFDFKEDVHRLSYEFSEFQEIVSSLNFEKASSLMHISLSTIKILENMRPYPY